MREKRERERGGGEREISFCVKHICIMVNALTEKIFRFMGFLWGFRYFIGFCKLMVHDT